ncbi:MAG: hypothetical protein VB081_08860 [Christensenella sp.]|uniref:hypothetical protein n=1 Tax=Christensenella sp. TaxID=1935934 RepID=UPI002B201EE3|nr:hypothetical protein [Christensenella sp.]MEA5003595.1 hypothetical protein [Christensenella sp.]
MNNNNSIPTTTDNDNLKSTILAEAQHLFSDIALSTEKESKEKYAAKAKLIEGATDMSTQEKLKALDKNNERRNQEKLQNAILAVVFLAVFGIWSECYLQRR